ncbi:hypothetical protein KC327_g9962 [Hortaea werneckii]|uniref:C3H1-type domain-containing protein n=1 Tax=Hortaea werneckii EXF-2000 TaxID=1157616 RepID=A0A1Z5TT17_HORWE|nr:hypothetical protein KC366_g3273 [Hortaea werneckii]OTA39167.1 hypothetical protein BTJ68_00831 [Hortaea werneckii EXF-2000]KAI7067862.1 hypothetical protein KC327_g9962 [Hortaea werneckii]KAI7134995.1 hypothetical protein KC337_g3366 [Hortaea werneckii]KAI7435010.1 hypothetical protein KC336_g3706 [Hortaea werneckii]
MSGMQIEANSALAQTIQSAAQAKLMEAGWAAEENDTTLSEYVTMMLVNGQDFQRVQAELGGELLGVGEDDPAVADFTRWLFEQAQALTGPQQQQQQEPDPGATTQEPQVQDDMQGQSMEQDEMMGEGPSADGIPSGPKAMRNGDGTRGGRGGRGGRMLGQMNRNMDRTSDDPLRRIKGAASGAGRIDAHAARAPRGPRGGNVANGVQRMMNGRGGAAMAGQMNPMMPQGQSGPMGGMDAGTQMQFMQMMEMQAQMMAQMMGQNGQSPQGAGGFRGGRGGRPIADRLGGKRGGGKFQGKEKKEGTEDGEDTAMSLDKPLTDTDRSPPFSTMCKFNHKCLNPECPFAHQSPANTRPGITLDMNDTCAYGAACKNPKCLARHPSPAQRAQHTKSEVDCKFFPNCSAGAMCPFRHPDTRPCRNGADCKVEGCPFAHSSIACRYNPCTRPDCPYKHAEGQKRGKYEDKVWTANGGDGGSHLAGGEPMDHAGKSDRFAELKENEGQAEELILPGGANAAGGQQNGNAEAAAAPGGDSGQHEMPQLAS